MPSAVTATAPMRVTDWKIVNAATPGRNAVARLATGSIVNATRKGRRRPRRSPNVEKARAASEAVRVAATTQLIWPSVRPIPLRANGNVWVSSDPAYPAAMPAITIRVRIRRSARVMAAGGRTRRPSVIRAPRRRWGRHRRGRAMVGEARASAAA